MQTKILNSVKELIKNNPISLHQFKITKGKTKYLKIKPTFSSYFKRKDKRKYKIILPSEKIKEMKKMSNKEIIKMIEKDIAFVLESQALPPVKLAGFTIQYLATKKEMNKREL